MTTGQIAAFLAGSALTFAQLALLLYAALAFSWGALRCRSVHVKLCAATVAAYWIPCAIFVALIPFGLFDRIWTTALLSALVLCTHAAWGRHVRWKSEWLSFKTQSKNFWQELPPPVRWLTYAVGAVFLVRFSRGLIAPPLAWDALTYHLLKAGRWVQNGGWVTDTAPDVWQIYEWFPPLGDVYWAWAMLGTHTDAWVTPAGALIWLSLIPAIYSIARLLLATKDRAWLAVLAGITVPACFGLLTAAYIDNTGYALVMIGSALLIAGVQSRSTTDTALALISFAMAVAVKITFIPYLMVALVITCFVVYKNRKVLPILYAIPFVLVAFHWQLFLLYSGKSIFYPAPLSIMGYQLEVGQPEMIAQVYPTQRFQLHYGWEVTKSFLRFLFETDSATPTFLNIGITFPLLMLAGTRALWKARAIRPRTISLALLGLTLSGAAITLTFWVPSTLFYRAVWLNNMGRFFLSFYAILIILIISGRNVPNWNYFLVFTTASLNVFLVWPRAWDIADYGCAGIGLALTSASFLTYKLLLSRVLVKQVIGTGVLTVILLCLLLARAETRLTFYTNPTRHYEIFHNGPDFSPQLLQYLPENEELIINFTGEYGGAGYKWFRFPFMGNFLQNHVIYIPPTDSGISWGGIMRQPPPKYNYNKWISRLADAEVDYIVCIRRRPIEADWMMENPANFELVYRHPKFDWHLFKVLK